MNVCANYNKKTRICTFARIVNKNKHICMFAPIIIKTKDMHVCANYRQKQAYMNV